jgi:hypothetical protein
MADEPTDEDLSKLELPSLRLPGLGRRKKRVERADEPSEPAGKPEPVAARQPESRRETAPATVSAPVHDSAPEPAPAGVAPTAERRVAPAPKPEPEPEPRSERESETEPVSPTRAARTWSMPRPTLPALSGRVAAAVTGLVVGIAGAALTYLSLRGCEAVKGTESCGGAGVPILVVILALMVLAGAAVLAVWGVSEARGTSFLGVGVLCVILLVALIEELFSGWMFLVVPVLAALSFVVAHWVTTAFVEPQPEPGPQHDVR